MTFIIQTNSPTALGFGGGGLGFANIPNSVAIKFDAYKPSGNHSSTGLYIDGTYPNNTGLPPGNVFQDLAGTGIDFNASAQSGTPHTFQAMLTYDGTTLTETITDETTSATVSFSYTVNIAAIVGSNVAYVGFGGGSGGLTAVQDILSWTYTTLDPGQPGGTSLVAGAPAAGAAPAVMAAPATDPAGATTATGGAAPAAARSSSPASPAPVANVIPQSLIDTAAVDSILGSYSETPKSRKSALSRLVSL
jgi:hypothetical protein